MIERCNYCGKEHETGDGSTFHGAVTKECPEHPQNPMFTFIDRKAFQRLTIDNETWNLRLVTVEDDKARYEVVHKYRLTDNLKVVQEPLAPPDQTNAAPE